MKPIFPPHLPGPSSSIDLHRRFGNLKLFIVVTIISVVAGLSGAAMLLSWVWPYVGGSVINTTSVRTIGTHSRLDERVRHDLETMVLNVYSNVSTAYGVEALAREQFAGPAVVVGGDGWLVMYHPGVVPVYKNWHALSANGTRFRVISAVPDARSGLLYLKVEREGTRNEPLRPAVFADSRALPDETFVLDGGVWHSAFVEGSAVRAISLPHLDSAPTQTFVLSKPASSGAIVINGNGELVGLVRADQLVLPAEHINRAWQSVRELGRPMYKTLGVEGIFSEEETFFANAEAQHGFLVTRIITPTSTLRRGDVIISLGGNPVSAAEFWDALSAPAVRATVWRGKAAKDLTVPVQKLP